MSKEASFSDDKMSPVPTDLTAEAPVDSALYIEPQEERKLLRKMDAVLISVLGMLYLLSFLDRAAIGNANIAVLKIVGAKPLMTASTMMWGSITIGTAFVSSFDHLVACRVLLGAAEAGLFPCVNIYLASQYRPNELGRRLSYIFVCAALSGAFGGLLAFGLTQITTGPLLRWQYLYLVEGLISFMAAPVVWFVLPNSLDQAWWLTPRQRELCTIRYEINKRNYDPNAKFSWSEVRLAATDWKTWTSAVNQFCIDVTLYGLTTFMPTLIKGMKLTTNPVFSQLLTVPVYVVAAASYVVGAHFSDKYQNRSIPIAVNMLVAVVGYIVIAVAANPSARFVGVFIVGLALYGACGLNVTWCNNITANHFRRATSIGLMQLVGNSSGAAIGFIFSAKDAPHYTKGLWIAVGLSLLSVCITTGQALALKRLNRINREKVAAGAPDQPELGSDNPHFVYML